MKNRIQFRPAPGLLIPLVLACFALSPRAQAQGTNTALGTRALDSLTTGVWNTALGYEALLSDETGSTNTATGLRSLMSNVDGVNNTATGVLALSSNTSGSNNTAIGQGALADNNGSLNTATGVSALANNTMGGSNSAFGFDSLSSNTTGVNNNAFGRGALGSNTAGGGNIAFGNGALDHNVGGHNNTAIGSLAGLNITGSGNVCIGFGVFGAAGESNTTKIRNVYASVASDRAVYVNSNNKLGTLASSRRFKDEIKPMDKASETILALKPVTFRYKKEIEPNSVIMFGLIAEEVEKIAPELVTRDDKGQVETVRYDAVNAMLLNEFLKEHRKVEELEKGIEALRAQFKEQAAQIQKVSAQVEISRPAPQTVLNNQ
jgi:hypothetical protein